MSPETSALKRPSDGRWSDRTDGLIFEDDSRELLVRAFGKDAHVHLFHGLVEVDPGGDKLSLCSDGGRGGLAPDEEVLAGSAAGKLEELVEPTSRGL